MPRPWVRMSDPATMIEIAGSTYDRGSICPVCLARLDGTRVFEFGPITLDRGRGVVEVDGVVRAVQPQRVEMLAALMRQPGKVFPKERLLMILENAGSNATETSRAIDVQLCRLRKDIAPHGDLLQTVWGVGVRLVPPLAATRMTS